MRDALLDALAVFRLTRLVTTDDITAELREAVIEAAYVSVSRSESWRPFVDRSDLTWTAIAADDEDAPKLATLVTCRWCASMWAALAIVALRRAPGWRLLRDALALSAATGLLSRLDET